MAKTDLAVRLSAVAIGGVVSVAAAFITQHPGWMAAAISASGVAGWLLREVRGT